MIPYTILDNMPRVIKVIFIHLTSLDESRSPLKDHHRTLTCIQRPIPNTRIFTPRAHTIPRHNTASLILIALELPCPSIRSPIPPFHPKHRSSNPVECPPRQTPRHKCISVRVRRPARFPRTTIWRNRSGRKVLRSWHCCLIL
jgi:hypothetical protein